jgi:hypothetical protein
MLGKISQTTFFEAKLSFASKVRNLSVYWDHLMFFAREASGLASQNNKSDKYPSLFSLRRVSNKNISFISLAPNLFRGH